MPSSPVRRFNIQRITGPDSERDIDEVATEEPLALRVRYFFKAAQHTEQFAVTMRTPGNDRELAAGLLLSEGVIRTRNDLADLRSVGPDPSNEIIAELAPNCDYDASRLARQGYVNSSCGVCGKRSIEGLTEELASVLDSGFSVDANRIAHLPERLREFQIGFAATGGLHAAALVHPSGQIEAVFEDIGRHNALDKLIGDCLLNDRLPLSNHLLFLSSRSSFELVQKALMAGAPMLATIGGPSSLAIELAREQGLTLLGFIRNGRFNVYAGEWRVHSEQDEIAVPRE